jgi:hypothetical protein
MPAHGEYKKKEAREKLKDFDSVFSVTKKKIQNL